MTSLTVLKGTVERSDWIGKNHPYKAHGDLQAGGVPCVLLWGNGQVLARAESRDDFQNEDLLTMIASGEWMSNQKGFKNILKLVKILHFQLFRNKKSQVFI